MGRSYLLALLKRLPQHLIESFMIVCSTTKDGDLTDQLDDAVRAGGRGDEASGQAYTIQMLITGGGRRLVQDPLGDPTLIRPLFHLVVCAVPFVRRHAARVATK